MTEEWQTIEGFPLYEVSSLGRVRSYATGKERELRGGVSGSGYRNVGLGSHASGIKYYGVHRLVALAFHGQPKSDQVVRHLDGDRLNNKASNLAWGTVSENMFDKVRHGTHHYANRDRCGRGHEYADGNRFRDARDGSRRCVICRRLVRALARQRARAASDALLVEQR